MDQLQGFEYCIDSNPSWGEAIVLGFQYYILVLGTAVMIPTLLVPLMGGNDRFLQTMRAIQGALIVSSSIQINLGYSQLWGIFSRFFSPLGMVPVVSLVGFGLFDRGFPVVGRCVEIGIPMLIVFVASSQYLKNIYIRRLPVLERFSLLITITIIWIYAHLLTVGGTYKHRPEHTQFNCHTDRSNLISSSPWIKIPYPLQWGAPTFDAGHSFGMMASVFVSLVEGGFKAAARLASATPPPAHVLSRGIGWQGIGILFDGLFGTATGSTVSVENVRLLGSTRVGSRRVIQISADFMIFFSILAKFGALFASIPFSIFAAAYCVLFGIPAAVGLSLQFTNMNSIRNLFIIGVSFLLGRSVPEYFFRYASWCSTWPCTHQSRMFNDYMNTIFTSLPIVALMVAILHLNQIVSSSS